MAVVAIVILLGLALLAIAIIGSGCVLLFWPKVKPAFRIAGFVLMMLGFILVFGILQIWFVYERSITWV